MFSILGAIFSFLFVVCSPIVIFVGIAYITGQSTMITLLFGLVGLYAGVTNARLSELEERV